MARQPAKKPEQIEEVGKPDFALAVKIWREDIKPAVSHVGEFAQEQSTAYKAIKKTAHIQPQAAKAAFAVAEMEESKRDDWLRGFQGLLTELKIFIRHDLVDAAEGKKAGDIVPAVAPRPKPQLVTLEGPPGDHDLNPDDAPVDPLAEAAE